MRTDSYASIRESAAALFLAAMCCLGNVASVAAVENRERWSCTSTNNVKCSESEVGPWRQAYWAGGDGDIVRVQLHSPTDKLKDFAIFVGLAMTTLSPEDRDRITDITKRLWEDDKTATLYRVFRPKTKTWVREFNIWTIHPQASGANCLVVTVSHK